MMTDLDSTLKQEVKAREDIVEAGGVGKWAGRITGYIIAAAIATKYDIPPGIVAACAAPIYGFAEVTGCAGKKIFKAAVYIGKKVEDK